MECVLEAEFHTAESATGVRVSLRHFSRYATGMAGW